MSKTYGFEEYLEQIDTDEIDMQIEKLEQNLPFEIEEPKLFAKRIIKQSKVSRKRKMLSIGKVIASVICIVLVGTTGIYGEEMYKLYKSYTFSYEQGIVHIKSGDGDLTEAQAKKLSEAAARQVDEGIWGIEEEGGSNEMSSIDEQYASVQEVEEALKIEIKLPEYIPNDCIQDKAIKVRRTEGEGFKFYYVEVKYKSIDELGKVLRVSAQYDQLGEGIVATQIVKGRIIQTYTNEKGDQYNMIEEDGSILAQTVKENMQYSVLFEGFSDSEMYEVIDSVDLLGD